MAAAKVGDTVKVHYTGALEDGQVFDSSQGRDPLEFTIGTKRLIPGFEEAVVGMNSGESKRVTIPAEKGYGPRRDDMIVDVDRHQLPAEISPQVGQHFQFETPGGDFFVVEVTEVSDATVKLDGNHPLAGKDLTFDIELIEVF